MMMKIYFKETFLLMCITLILGTILMNPLIFMDKLSFLLTSLVAVYCLIAFFCKEFIKLFYSNLKLISITFIIMMFILLMSFMYSSILLFYIFFEVSVIPIFIFIISWGSSTNKIEASYYLFFFTFFSSLLFFMGLFLINSMYGNFNFLLMPYFNYMNFDSSFIFFMMIVFLVKMPVFLFHIWLPLAHVESPMIGSMVLASIMLKLGGYGLYRFFQMFLMEMENFKMYLLTWGIWGAVLMAMMCLFQTDLKKTVAFSSVSHMSMILMALSTKSEFGKWGSISMMLSHGFISSLMFFGLGVLYYRFNSRNMFFLMGSILIMPLFSFWWFSIMLMNLSFPPFISFFSELFMMMSMVIKKLEMFLLGIALFMMTSFYSVNLMMYLISGLKKSNYLFMELSMMEHLILIFHFFYLTSSTSLMWMI